MLHAEEVEEAASDHTLAERFERAVDELLLAYETKEDRAALALACQAHRAMIAQREEDDFRTNNSRNSRARNGEAEPNFSEGIFDASSNRLYD
jgi:hypothetical protein